VQINIPVNSNFQLNLP